MRSALAAAALAVIVVGGCSDKPQFAGVGPWHVKRTKLRDASGRCEPTDLPDGRQGTWCFGQPGLRLGGQDASVDLYFGGTAPDAPVIEIQLQFRGCHEEPLETWLKTHFGAPFEQRGTRWFFRNPGAFVVADVPESSGRCTVRLLPRGEAAELERLKAAKAAPASPTPPPPP